MELCLPSFENLKIIIEDIFPPRLNPFLQRQLTRFREPTLPFTLGLRVSVPLKNSILANSSSLLDFSEPCSQLWEDTLHKHPHLIFEDALFISVSWPTQSLVPSWAIGISKVDLGFKLMPGLNVLIISSWWDNGFWNRIGWAYEKGTLDTKGVWCQFMIVTVRNAKHDKSRRGWKTSSHSFSGEPF